MRGDNQIKIKKLKFRSYKDVMTEQAAKKISSHLGESFTKWVRILQWRVREFRGDLDKALTCWDPVTNQQVWRGKP